MTDAEIEKLKALARVATTESSRHLARIQSLVALPRLLEERERLLEALRAAAEALRFVEAPPQLSIAAEAAILFAEAPTSKEQPTT